jgi:hypothetical protein
MTETIHHRGQQRHQHIAGERSKQSPNPLCQNHSGHQLTNPFCGIQGRFGGGSLVLVHTYVMQIVEYRRMPGEDTRIGVYTQNPGHRVNGCNWDLHRPVTSSPETSHCGLQMLADVLDNKQLRCGPCTMKGKMRMTWRDLNDQLRKTKNAKLILQLYKAERKGKRRKRWLTRIYCRYSYLRRKKEMKAVVSAHSFV